MVHNFKEIKIGSLIKQKVTELGIEMTRICNFFTCTEEEIKKMYESENIQTEALLRWSKLLEYDFFRIYSHHLILYAPPSSHIKEKKKSHLPEFRKNVYTIEIINFILELLEQDKKTRAQIIEEYRIPKTTLYKWIKKYKNK
ncbi:transposase [Chryseobacterium angstadtii]|uniref:Transposase n=1 Tax=Chryseobacterium angstadtii TaxID=558151 RepID=A0A0J7IH40_9FLAO|nr:transposase [Chryseobacterium angstadtii]